MGCLLREMEKWSLFWQAVRLPAVSSPKTRNLHFYFLRLCAVFSEGFESQRDRITTHVRFSPFLPLREFSLTELDRVRIGQQCCRWLGGRGGRGDAWTRSALLPKVTCLLKGKSGTLKAQFQNVLLIPVKEMCSLNNNLGSHLGGAHHFLKFLVFFPVK